MKPLFLAALALPLATAALAQAGPAEIKPPGPKQTLGPADGTTAVVQPGGVDNGGPGSVGTVAPGATGATNITNNPGTAGNSEKPEQPIGNAGSPDTAGGG
ncbi:hypothetical protein ASG52_16920 [Methylobacterium sp. Leaf456]|uniref:hypothetical protein n=1 Tax=Methylobacterium sp. Leaf456 TaxID=1736382 RepID=UPI0006F22380|nr:hypothetical protein [Methylobacterium sp. Leaf456]KQT60927.1 hypothetical protein ASG52_16920 [Methylobacterium sp. Leaf456]